MAIPAAAVAAARAAAKYGPAVLDQARAQLAKVTGGKVTDPANVAAYVGNSPQRMSVVAGAMVRSGFRVEDVLPADIVGEDKHLQQIRASAMEIVGRMQNQYAAGSDKSLQQSSSDIAADMLRVERVKTALNVFGSARAYTLCMPNGGIPADDFVWYDRVVRGVRG